MEGTKSSMNASSASFLWYIVRVALSIFFEFATITCDCDGAKLRVAQAVDPVGPTGCGGELFNLCGDSARVASWTKNTRLTSCDRCRRLFHSDRSLLRHVIRIQKLSDAKSLEA